MRLMLMIVAFLAVAPAGAVTLDQRGCAAYATWSGNLVWARGLGADRDMAHAEIAALDAKEPRSVYRLLLRDFDALWSTAVGWEAVMRETFINCVSREGKYADDA